MIERREDLRFAREARQAIRIGANASGSTLIATSRLSLRVARAIDLAHAARADRPSDFVGAEAGAWGQ